MLGQEYELPSWLLPEEIPLVQQLANQVTTTDSEAIAYGATTESFPLIGVDDYYLNPSYSRFDGSGYSIVVIDSGADLDHPIFGPDADSDGVADRIVYHHDYVNDDDDASDDHGHGTHIAGIVAGAAPGANLIILKVLNSNNVGFYNDFEAALQWAATPANVQEHNIVSVNMSITDNSIYSSNVALGGIDDEFAMLAGMNIGVSVSAGNNYGFFQTSGVAYPAADANVISVGATWDADEGEQTRFGATDFSTAPDRIAAFSQRHESLLHIFGPGALITSSFLNGSYAAGAGTSMAAPHVAGAIAVAQQMNEHI